MTTAALISFGYQGPIASTIMIATETVKKHTLAARLRPKMSIFHCFPAIIAGNTASILTKSRARLADYGDTHYEGPGTGQTCNRL
jgi:hypothetical protein